MLAQAIDFDAIRRALVSAVYTATGLPMGQVMMLEPEVPNAPRPMAPYVGLMVVTASTKNGYDYPIPVLDANGEATTQVIYTGPRAMTVSFECYGASHEQAYGIVATLQAAFDAPPVREQLRALNLAVYEIGNVVDLSQLLNTAYEGRAQMDVTFGMTSQLAIDTGAIDSADVTGTVNLDTTNVSVALTAPSPGA